jgi:PPOX class probable F420-dependent enzyme
MTNLQDQQVQELLERPNHAIVSTFNKDGSILSTVAWVNTEGDALAVNSAIGRRWPANLQRDPRVTLLIPEDGNPYNYVEVRGTATATRDGADEHINALTKKYINQDQYPFRQPGEERIKFVIAPEHVRHQKQG